LAARRRRILSTTLGAVMKAMIRMASPHRGQMSGSTS
jgi:hypothetical protein